MLSAPSRDFELTLHNHGFQRSSPRLQLFFCNLLEDHNTQAGKASDHARAVRSGRGLRIVSIEATSSTKS